MLQEPENGGGVHPNRIPSLQPNHDKKPNSSSEEPINQLPSSNQGESAYDQQKLSESPIAREEFSHTIKIVRDAKLKHECAVELVNHACTQLSSKSFYQIFYFLQNPEHILGTAVCGGIEEFVRILLHHFPNLIHYEVLPERNILQVAVEFRQEKIVDIIKNISPTTTKILCSIELELENTNLHLAGKLAPSFKLFSVSGAALQMQRELQWFKEVEKMTSPFRRERKNTYNETAKYVFRKEHKELAEQGEKWMKNTANSCMLVSTLIATMNKR
ncbi:hypothetical protein Dsin_014445 [Dipteronia sinensis]|uniref:Uncharacterized protein n=1 Tax=Dipteronia sinensis TaxID=43782 RepID=A0AAE0AMI8_9ROSI|nr:hypothetical protein Dsin_014445 [Dipteronia sinensis]